MSSIDRQFSAAPRAALPHQKQCPARKSRRTEDTNDCVETRTTRNIIQDENGRGQDRMRKNRAQRAPAKPSARPRYSENAKQDRGIRTPEGGLKTSGVEEHLVDLAPNEPTSSSAPTLKHHLTLKRKYNTHPTLLQPSADIRRAPNSDHNTTSDKRKANNHAK